MVEQISPQAGIELEPLDQKFMKSLLRFTDSSKV